MSITFSPTLVRPFANGFHGYVEADGQRAYVAALVTDAGTDAKGTYALSLVGTKVTLGAIVGNILEKHGNGRAYYAPPPELNWQGAHQLLRPAFGKVTYGATRLTGIADQHHLLLWSSEADLSVLALRPNLPIRAADMATIGIDIQYTPRIVFANHDQDAPHPLSWAGYLVSVGLPFTIGMVQRLWHLGLEAGLLTPLAAVGMRAWNMNGDPGRWANLYAAHANELQQGVA